MNVASVELCRELYELSGWTCGVVHHNLREVTWEGDHVADHWGVYKETTIRPSDENPPAYDLGYLLRKLPPDLQPDAVSPSRRHLTMYVRDADWHFYYGKRPTWLGKYAITPEDAACKLAIELFKAGVLGAERSKSS